MATKHFCDICGKEINGLSKVDCEFWGPRTVNDNDVELCHECYEELRNFIAMRKMGYEVRYVMED